MKVTKSNLRDLISEIMIEVLSEKRESDRGRSTSQIQNKENSRHHIKRKLNESMFSLLEGDVVNLFPDDREKQNAVERIARALAARAEELLDNKIGSVEASLDLDGSGDSIEVDVDVNIDPDLYKLFLEPYPDIDGHGDLVTALAEQIYGHTSHEDVVGTSEDPLGYILGRIETDMYDEDIEYALEALGDDRFAPPFVNRFDGEWKEQAKAASFDEKLKSIYGKDSFTQDEIDTLARASGFSEEEIKAAKEKREDKSQHSKTKEMAAKQDSSEVEEMGMDFERFLQGIESGDVAELEQEDD